MWTCACCIEVGEASGRKDLAMQMAKAAVNVNAELLVRLFYWENVVVPVFEYIKVALNLSLKDWCQH